MAKDRTEKTTYGISCSLCAQTGLSRYHHLFSMTVDEMGAHVRVENERTDSGQRWLASGGLDSLMSFRHSIRDIHGGKNVSAEEFWLHERATTVIKSNEQLLKELLEHKEKENETAN